MVIPLFLQSSARRVEPMPEPTRDPRIGAPNWFASGRPITYLYESSLIPLHHEILGRLFDLHQQ